MSAIIFVVMENNTQQPIGTSATPQMPVEPAVPSNKPNLLVISLVIIETITLLVAGYFGYQFMQLKKQLTEPQPTSTPISNSTLPTVSPIASGLVSPTPDPTANWKNYLNSGALYQVKYPNTWRIVESSTMVGFGPQEIGEDVLWAINTYSKSEFTKDKIIADLGKQFADRKQATKTININGVQALEVITTTPSIPTWYSDTLIIEYGSSYIVISNGAINNTEFQKMRGVPSGTTFELFYSTFKFMN